MRGGERYIKVRIPNNVRETGARNARSESMESKHTETIRAMEEVLRVWESKHVSTFAARKLIVCLMDAADNE